MNAYKLAFIGFGEVAACLSRAMCQKGAEVFAYDILLDQDNGLKKLQERTLAQGISFLPLKDAVPSANYILSTVTTHVAEKAARSCADYLKPGQTFLDLNATAPSVKQTISRIILSSGAEFVEGAILGAVGVTGSQTRILTGGIKGAAAAESLSKLGLNVAYYSPDIGKASTFKMLRSIFSKGLEALLLEFLIAGERAGIQDDLWQEICDLFAKNPFDRIANNWIQTHATAHGRRYHEMKQVTAVVSEIGLDPILTACTEAFFKRSCGLGLKKAFPEKPDSAKDVIKFMEKRLN